MWTWTCHSPQSTLREEPTAISDFVFPASTTPSVAAAASSQRFPVLRIYCVSRNCADQAREISSDPPVFFMKPADAVVANGSCRHSMSSSPATSFFAVRRRVSARSNPANSLKDRGARGAAHYHRRRPACRLTRPIPVAPLPALQSRPPRVLQVLLAGRRSAFRRRGLDDIQDTDTALG